VADELATEIKGKDSQFLSVVLPEKGRITVGKFANISCSLNAKVDLRPQDISPFGFVDSQGRAASLVLAPLYPSTVVALKISERNKLIISPQYFLAATQEVEFSPASNLTDDDVTAKTPTALYLCSGKGTIWLAAGGDHQQTAPNGDTLLQFGAIIAFSAGLKMSQILNYQRNPWASRSQQTYVALTGLGTIHLQTRDPLAFSKKIGSLTSPRPAPVLDLITSEFEKLKATMTRLLP
jgi:uncharacterized protein (AIM24 family)